MEDGRFTGGRYLQHVPDIYPMRNWQLHEDVEAFRATLNVQLFRGAPAYPHGLAYRPANHPPLQQLKYLLQGSKQLPQSDILLQAQQPRPQHLRPSGLPRNGRPAAVQQRSPRSLWTNLMKRTREGQTNPNHQLMGSFTVECVVKRYSWPSEYCHLPG